MNKTICEKSLFNILFYRMHKSSFDRFSLRNKKICKEFKLNNNNDKENSFEWIKLQSNYIDKHGLEHWIKNSDSVTGLPKHINIRSSPFSYNINFRTNMFRE